MMGVFFDFCDEEQETCHVEFELLETEESIWRYGIRAKLFRNGELAETSEVTERYLTKEEAKEMMKVLCQFQVTPCTLQDIV